MSPEGERIELFENAALNLTFTQDAGYQDAVAERHNRPLAIPIAFHHIHLYLPAGKVAEAKAWYAQDVRRRAGQALELRRGRPAWHQPELQRRAAADLPTKGRMLDHLGFEIRWTSRPSAGGSKRSV